MNRLIAFLLTLLCLSAADALHQGDAAPAGGGLTFPMTYYKSFPSGWNSAGDITKFPIAWWNSQPQVIGHNISPYKDIAHAAVGLNAPIFYANGNGWPAGFGVDNGDAAAVHAANAFMIGGGATDYNSNVSKDSVASQQAVWASVGGNSNNIGYFAVDEPGQTTGCTTSSNPGPPHLGGVPAAIAAIHSKDATRVTVNNMSQMPWYSTKSAILPCGGGTAFNNAFLASDYPSYDQYANIDPYARQASECYAFQHVVNTDGATYATDCSFTQGVGVGKGQDLIAAGGKPKPQWAFISAGGDALASDNNTPAFWFNTTAGSDIITINAEILAITPGLIFTNNLWINPPGGSALVLRDLGGKPCFAGSIHLTSIISATQAHTDMNTATNLTCNGNGGAHSATISGGTSNPKSWCNTILNLCPGGTQYRDTPVQVSQQVWQAITAGALGIIWFQDDLCSYFFGFGDSGSCGSAATTAARNVQYIGGVLNSFASKIQLPEDARCNMTAITGKDSPSCSSNGYTMTTSKPACPGLMKITHDSEGTYIFAMSNRASTTSGNCDKTGARMTFSGLSALNGKTATIIYDQNARYDPVHDHTRTAATVSAGSVAFPFGADSNSYQFQLIKIQ